MQRGQKKRKFSWGRKKKTGGNDVSTEKKKWEIETTRRCRKLHQARKTAAEQKTMGLAGSKKSPEEAAKAAGLISGTGIRISPTSDMLVAHGTGEGVMKQCSRADGRNSGKELELSGG